MDAKRLNETALRRARYQRLQEIQMWAILREIFTYAVFLSLLYTVAYSNHNVHSFTQVDHLRKYLLNSKQDRMDYNEVCFSLFEKLVFTAHGADSDHVNP